MSEATQEIPRILWNPLLAPRPTPKLEDYPLSAFRDCLFNIFAATLHNCRPFLHPQPQDAPCRGDRDPLISDRDPLIMGSHTQTNIYYLFLFHCNCYANAPQCCVMRTLSVLFSIYAVTLQILIFSPSAVRGVAMPL